MLSYVSAIIISVSKSIYMLERFEDKLEKLKKGLEWMSKDRKVVLPHHKTFELVEEMLEIVESLKKEKNDK
tara:strand:+ start:5175 stop:5387 length:213 start_codon:yes stop_codon:yes gene_type:complete